MNTAQTLSRAAEVIRERGWWQKGAPHGGYCALTAIGSVVGVDGRITDPVYALAKYLGHTDEDTAAAVVIAWNDAPERTVDEVTTALEVAGLIAGAELVEVVSL